MFERWRLGPAVVERLCCPMSSDEMGPLGVSWTVTASSDQGLRSWFEPARMTDSFLDVSLRALIRRPGSCGLLGSRTAQSEVRPQSLAIRAPRVLIWVSDQGQQRRKGR